MIARISETATGRVASIEWGMIEDRDRPHFWRPSNRARKQEARGQKAPGNVVRAAKAALPGRPLETVVPEMPWQRLCPACGVIALVTADVLGLA